jgi:hypothetical protein
MMGISSALRWPQAYSLSYMIVDYHFGFGKRGFLGSIFDQVDKPPFHYVTLATFAFAVFGVWLVMLIYAARRLMSVDFGVASALILFFLSAGFSSLVCDVGRGEHFGLTLAISCLLLPYGASWLILRLALLFVSLLAQEANYFIAVPPVLLDLWLATRHRNFNVQIFCLLSLMLPCTSLTIYMGSTTTCVADAAAYFQRMAADFRFEPMAVATLCNDGAKNLELVRENLWSIGTQFVRIPLALIVTLPLVVLNIYLAARVLGASVYAVFNLVMVAFSPCLLVLVGVDVERFVTLSQVTSLLALISAARRVGLPVGGTLVVSRRGMAIVIGLATFELGSSLTLNDGSQTLKFPYTPLVVRLISVLQGHEPFVVIQ